VTYGAVIEARMASTRLPGKVLMEVMPGATLIDAIVARARLSRRLGGLVLATSVNPKDDAVARHCETKGIPVFRGSENDVLGRVLGAAKAQGFDRLVRLTGDNPLIDGRILDDLIGFFEDGGYDYVATTMMSQTPKWKVERTFPRGISMEVVTLGILTALEPGITDPLERESLTFHVYDHPERHKLGAFQATGKYAALNHPDIRLTVDTPEDLDLVRRVYAALGAKGPASFTTVDAVKYVADHPELLHINAHVAARIVTDLKAARKAAS
jgi:spore coat polysaccharide biosynthesis protein SpsF